MRTSLVPLSICLWEVLACGDSSPKFKVFAVSFRFCAEFTKRFKPRFFWSRPSQVREYLPCSTANNEFPLRGNFEGRRGRETRLFAKRKCRALLVYKQSYGSFEMVSPPRKQLYINRKMNFKISAIPWFRLNFKLFYDREKEPRSKAARFLPPRPSLPLAFYMDYKNWIQRVSNFSKQPQNSVRTSFGCCSICLWEVRNYGACSFGLFEAAPAKESWGGGEENTDLSRRESRYLACKAECRKTNLWLLWDGPLPRENSRFWNLLA